LQLIRHAGLDPASSLHFFWIPAFAGMTGCEASRRVLNPKRIKILPAGTPRMLIEGRGSIIPRLCAKPRCKTALLSQAAVNGNFYVPAKTPAK
jgi:hypothetical protein